jgi:tetratricopeptide (TPR) repeat protein
VKRGIVALLLLLGSLAAVYGYFVTRRESSHRDLILRGDAALASGDPSTAIELFSGAIALRDDAMIGYLKRGEAYRRRDELEAALRDLRRAAEIDPAATRPRELLGDVNYARNRFGPAAEHYEAYVGLDDSSPRVLYKLGLARYRAGQPALAVASLTKAVALDDRAETHYLMGLCLRDSQRPTQAVASLSKAIGLAPTMLQAREELADLYEKLGRTDESHAQLEALRALNPSAARDVTLGLAYAAAGQSDRAIVTLRHAAQRHPEHRYTYVALGRVWLETAQARADHVDLGKAVEALEKAITAAHGQESSEAYALLGRALLLQGDVERAEMALRQATQKLPAEPLAFFYLGDAAERRGHYDVARQALLDYAGLVGEEPDARRRALSDTRIAELSVRLADFPTAATYFERSAAFSNDPDMLVKLADARWRAGQVDEASVVLARVLEKHPQHTAALTLAKRLKKL